MPRAAPSTLGAADGPILGRLRYLLEHIGPEFRQYLFDADLEGKPFTREGYRSIVYAGKYMKTLISFG
jgi:glutamate synthase (ferredoxin)